MKKYCDWWLLPLLACLLAGCGDDDYHYPSVKLEFLTAFSGADGYLRSVVTDEGETLPVVEDKTKTNIEANALVRVISNYASEVTADGTAGAVLYALSGVLSVAPKRPTSSRRASRQTLLMCWVSGWDSTISI